MTSALTLRKRHGDPYPCNAPEHTGPSRSGRFHVAICGFPVRNERGDELCVCGPCAEAIKKAWAEADNPYLDWLKPAMEAAA